MTYFTYLCLVLGTKGTAYTLLTPRDKEFAPLLVRNLEGANQFVTDDLMQLAMQVRLHAPTNTPPHTSTYPLYDLFLFIRSVHGSKRNEMLEKRRVVPTLEGLASALKLDRVSAVLSFSQT